MDHNFSFEKGLSSDSEESKKADPVYFCDAIKYYSESQALDPKLTTFVLFGQPIENRNIYAMEKRQGCDLAANVIHKRLKSSRFAFSNSLKEINIVSFLNYFQTHPLKIEHKEPTIFYKVDVFWHIVKLLGSEEKKFSDIKFIDFAGSIDFLMEAVSNHLNSFPNSSTCILKFSPFVYKQFCLELKANIFHFGLDYKFDFDFFHKKTEGEQISDRIYYDIEKGAEHHFFILEKLLASFENAEVIFDCQVFSSEYFQGSPMPFPFSYSRKEIAKIFELLIKSKNKIRFLGFCHFNPTVEEKRSVAFLMDFIYKFICE